MVCNEIKFQGLASSLKISPPITDYKKIIIAVEKITGINYRTMYSKTRKRPVVEARQLAMYFIKQYTSLTLKEIGKKFGNRDHSTVIYALDNVKDLAHVSSDFKNFVTEIKNRIYEN